MQTFKRKGIHGVLLAAIIVIGLLAGVCRPCESAAAGEDFRTWRQLDERWADLPLGGSTVARSGCYITSIAMVAVASGARDTESFDPGVFAKALNDMGAFSPGGALVSWGDIQKAVNEVSVATPNINFTSTDPAGKAKEIKSYLDKGQYVICNVGGHWVYIDGVIGDEVYMADPAKDEILMFEAYNNSSITFFQVFNGKNKYSGFTPLTVFSKGEYYCPQGRTVNVYADKEDKTEAVAVLEPGYVVSVSGVSTDMGQIYIGGYLGWIDLTELEFAGKPQTFTAGDINNDGVVNEYDLALLNDYLDSRWRLPYGVSTLTSSELAAADINGDGVLSDSDVLYYLMLICD